MFTRRSDGKSDGYVSHCKPCRQEKYRAIKDTPEFKEGYENSRLKQLYGITLEDKKRLEDQQRGACAICLAKDSRLLVDHCHESGVVRGLLCNRCNVGLGFVESGFLDNAISYLTKER